MSDYLGNLAARSLNLAGVLRPRLASIFEPLPAFGKQIDEYLADDVPVQSQPVQSPYSNSVPGRADSITWKQESRLKQPEPEEKKKANYNTLHKPNLVRASSSKQTSQGADSLDARHGLTKVRAELNDRNTPPGFIVSSDKMVRGERVERFPISGDGHPSANYRQHHHPGSNHYTSSQDDPSTGEVSSEYNIQENYSHNVPSGEHLNRPEPETVMPPAEIRPESANLPMQDLPSIRASTAPIKSVRNVIPVDQLPSDAVADHSELDPASNSANVRPGEPEPKAAHLRFSVLPGEGSNRPDPQAVMPPVEIKPESANLPMQDLPSIRASTAPIKSVWNVIPVDRLPSEAREEPYQFNQALKATNARASKHPQREPMNHISGDRPSYLQSTETKENKMPLGNFVRDKAALNRSENPAQRVHAYDRSKNNLIPEKLHAASHPAARPLKGPSSKRKAEDSRNEKNEPSISVTIGRIEVRAAPAQEKPVQKLQPSPKVQILSLDDYLRLRNGGQR